MIRMAAPMPAQVSQTRRRAPGEAGRAGAVPRRPAAAAAVTGAVAGAGVTGAVAGAAPGGGAEISPAALISLLIVPRWSVS